MAEIGSAHADEVEGSGTVVPADGAGDGAGEQPVTLAGVDAGEPEAGAAVGELAVGAGEPDADAVSGEPQAGAENGAAGGAEGAVPAVAATGFMQRAVIRRRVRFLRRRRELALHDLGGFTFESHRLGQPREELLAQKLSAIGELDHELATLQDALGQREELAVLREPGISSCPQCSTIHDSAARYCPTCGRPTAAGAS